MINLPVNLRQFGVVDYEFPFGTYQFSVFTGVWVFLGDELPLALLN